MKEAYVKFKTAQRLKEKGFDWEVNGYFCSDVDNPSRIEWSTKDYNSHKFHVSAPTQQMGCDWVEKTYGFFIEISRSVDLNGNYHYFYMILDKACRYASEATKNNDYSSKSDAVEAALTYVLNKLI